MNKDKLVANDIDAIREIELCIVNNGEIYKQCIALVINMLAKKVIKGTYNKDLAYKAFIPSIEAQLKEYSKQFGGIWFKLLSVNDRNILAYNLVTYYDELLKDKVKDLYNINTTIEHLQEMSKVALAGNGDVEKLQRILLFLGYNTKYVNTDREYLELIID